MKSILSATIFVCSSSSSPYSRFLFTRTTLSLGLSHFSTSSPDSSSYSSSRRNSDDIRNVRVSVWWDFENCTIPCDANVFKLTQSITAAVRANGIKGPIKITAFGDVLQLSRANQEALSSTGINLTHIPNGGKNSADRSLLMDLMFWVSQNPPPAHLFLISGDRDFASILHRLRMNNYNILLASTDNAPAVLCSAASIMWQWTALVKGENLSGKHFNQPPDGPFSSWYGHFRGHLEDPFSVSHQTSCVQSEESSDSNSNTMLRPIPKAVVSMIRSILNSYPKGISITELRSELGKSNVFVEKDLYGHKKFSRFLLALPQMLTLQSEGDGQFIVRGVGPKSPKSDETCVPTPDMATVPNTSTKDSVSVMVSKENGHHIPSVVGPREDNLLSPPNLILPKPCSDSQAPPYSNSMAPCSNSHALPCSDTQAPPEKQEEPQQVQEQPPSVENARNDEVKFSPLHPTQVKRHIPDVGIFKTLWSKWFNGIYSYQGTRDTFKECSTKQDSVETVNTDLKGVQSTGQSTDPARSHASSLSTDKGIPDAETSAENVDTFSKANGIFSQIVRGCKFWRSDKKSDNLNAELSESDKEITSRSEMQEMLTVSFWDDMLAFLETPKGLATILQSKTRQEMVQKFQQLGPPRLQSLSRSHILRLVELLLVEKKWIEECPSQTFPFKFVGPARNSSCSKPSNSKDHTKKSKELTESESSSQGKIHYREDISENHTHLGSSMLPRKKKLSPKTRSQILADCQKLVNEVVKQYPDGFNIGDFKKLFLDRYGYHLEVQQLGYQKLATLLQIMPGVKLESNYIIPPGDCTNSLHSEKAGSSIEEHPKSDLSRKEDDHDSHWEELGPIAQTDTKKAADDGHGFEEEVHDFEALSDNDLSDSEDESLSGGNEKQAKGRTEENSSLLQILDFWYSNKDDSNRNRRVASECSDTKIDNSNDTSKPPSSGEAAKGNTTTMPNYEQKQKPSKRYSFVVDKPGNDKEKLINGILGSLKKSGDASLES